MFEYTDNAHKIWIYWQCSTKRETSLYKVKVKKYEYSWIFITKTITLILNPNITYQKEEKWEKSLDSSQAVKLKYVIKEELRPN